jgi:hypothetical protein
MGPDAPTSSQQIDDITTVRSSKERIVFGSSTLNNPTTYCVKCANGLEQDLTSPVSTAYYADYQGNQVTSCIPIPHKGIVRVASAPNYCEGGRDGTEWAQPANLDQNPCRIENCPYPGSTTNNVGPVIQQGDSLTSVCKYGSATGLCDHDHNDSSCTRLYEFHFPDPTNFIDLTQWEIVDHQYEPYEP